MLSWLNLGTPTCFTSQQDEKGLGLIPGGCGPGKLCQ